MFYKYHGRVSRVVDADTVDADLDLGFGITMRQRFRIDEYDAPETWRPRNEAEKNHGIEATARAIQLLAEEDLVFITSKTIGIFGRYGAQIILKDGRDFGNVMIQEGFSKKEEYDGITIPKG
jgi:endonuclease YncB( thermonuclease family)